MRSVIVLTVILLPSHHYADCQYTECRYANCRYTECRSTIKHCYSCLIILIKVRFYPTCAKCYKTFYVRNFKSVRNKLECLSLASLSIPT
jgi:hypothetical protein